MSEQQWSTCQNITGESVSLTNLNPGSYYLTQVSVDGSSSNFCELGLRLNLTVLAQDCWNRTQANSSSESLCTGRGDCIWKADLSKEFTCYCNKSYTGVYCDEYDGCSLDPCANNATCSDVLAGPSAVDFLCYCPQGFTGECI